MQDAAELVANAPQTCSGTQAEPSPNASRQRSLYLTEIPAELIDAILSYLDYQDVVSVSGVCKTLRKHAHVDLLWQGLVQQNLPGTILTSPGPCATYRELYALHDRLWFLPKYKIWFCNLDALGKVIIVRYDPRKGSIQGYQLVSINHANTTEEWADNRGIAANFKPALHLHLDKPVLQFRFRDKEKKEGAFSTRPGENRYSSEIPIAMERLNGMRSNFLLTRSTTPQDAEKTKTLEYPYGLVGPPPTIPANDRVFCKRLSDSDLIEVNERPERRSQVCDKIFRLREWMQMPVPMPNLRGTPPGFAGVAQFIPGYRNNGRVHVAEEIFSYSTLDPKLYTPTATKPWRGIWVGDYSGHGCEFVLIHQPDDPVATDAELGIFQRADESGEEWEARRREARLYRGRLEAIKLTGDPNIPRGEYTFIAEDLGDAGFIGTTVHPPFPGSRVVKSKGHIAATGFVRDSYIDSHLILISHNKLAQFWLGFGHISYFERVDIDKYACQN